MSVMVRGVHLAEDMQKGIQRLSIIIPTLNEEKFLPSLLTSIAEQRVKANLQIIVVDGHSTDRTVAIAKSFRKLLPDLLVVSAKRDIGNQRNTGVRYAKYDHLLFLDADVTLPPQAIDKLLKQVDPNQRIVSTVIQIPDRFDVKDYIVASIFQGTIAAFVHTKIPLVLGSFILTTKENHQRIRGFKVGATLGEDVDYVTRSVKDGASYKLLYNTHINISARRLQKYGHLNALRVGTKMLTHTVFKGGPIYDDINYPFGEHSTDNT